MSRIITVFSTETNEKKEINTTAATWGALKTELSAQGLSTSNMKGMVKETKTTLESDGAILPTTTFTLFITPTKVKSGIPSGPIKKAVVKKAPAKKAPAKKLVAKKASPSKNVAKATSKKVVVKKK